MKSDYQIVKDALHIEEVIDDFVRLQRKGSNYIGLCPFHEDSHASMIVSPTRQTYKCFSCGASGDVIEFVQKHEHLKNSYEALMWCAKRANITLEEIELTPEQQKQQKLKESLQVGIQACSDFFSEHLLDAKEYLITRGYHLEKNADILSTFKIGYAPDNGLLNKTLLKRGFSEKVLKDVNTIGKTDKGFTYDVFRDRLMFPFLDLQGRVTGFSGRIVTPREKTGKYLNTSSTSLFKKGKALFGLYQAKKEIAKKKYCYLVEGQFDVLSLHAVGVCNTIAGSGTALTQEQANLIHRFTDRVVLVYDSDAAGVKASLKNTAILLANGIKVECIHLKAGQDPDNLALSLQEKTADWLLKHTVNFVEFFSDIMIDSKVPETFDQTIDELSKLLVNIPSETLKISYIRFISEGLDLNTEIIEGKIKEHLPSKITIKKEDVKPGFYGLEELKKIVKPGSTCTLTCDFETFVEDYDTKPTVLISGIPTISQIQELRRICQRFFVKDYKKLSLKKDTGEESDLLKAVADMYKAGITSIATYHLIKEFSFEDADEEVDCLEKQRTMVVPTSFIKAYVEIHSEFIEQENILDTTFCIERCAELLAFTEDAVRIVNFEKFYKELRLTKAALTEIMKPYLLKRKSKIAINAQRQDDDSDEYNPDEIPEYVEENEEYSQMYRQCNFYPKLNKEGEPVCYMFRNGDKGGHTQVGDFYMTPLLHIYSENADENRRIFKINRRYYKNPLFIEVQSKQLLRKSTIEEVLINLEAVNFTNGEEKHWTKIREYMSRHYITCGEIKTYGNQQQDGFSLKEDNNFFAFANGIFHVVDGVPKFEPSDELGVVTHNNTNYFLPAYSSINTGQYKHSDKYELISTLSYKEIPVDKRCSFEHWSSLMDKVYKLNDNGKWAILFAIMCAFRTNIHCIDRIFTAPFFMGPMSGGKTQIAISIRSLFISPKEPIFNLNIGTDAAMATMMSIFRDVPIVLDEYNNKDISDKKFQSLKGIVYDGDGKQKRKGVGNNEIENDKVFAPVVICGQETPQRDDNALMSRIIVCEVPKPRVARSKEEIELFNELKEIEDPDKVGLSNILLEILQLRPLVQKHFQTLKKECYEELKEELEGRGEMDRLMKTASLFLATCKLIHKHTELKLPFTYKEFKQVAIDKIQFQIGLISKTDKLAIFFKAMDVMIDSKTLREGRDFEIAEQSKVTIKNNSDKKEVILNPGTRVLFLRFNSIYANFARSSFNTEDTTQSTIEQNMRSHPSYIGIVSSRRFKWMDVIEVPKGNISSAEATEGGDVNVDNTMIRKMEKRSTNTSCIAINYSVFKELYDIDFERNADIQEERKEQDIDADMPF